jgi:dienelactone hydrolase
MNTTVKLTPLFLFVFAFGYGQNPLSLKDITVLKEPADTMMRSYLTDLVDQQFSTRDSLLASLRSAESWDLRSQTIRDSIISWTGPFPPRTPLNARTTGRIEKKDYTLEKIIFESRPNFLVTANLYLPKNVTGPHPAVLNVIGHFQEGKAADVMQRLSIAQARNGFVALTMDCMGQGERQIYGIKPTGAHATIGIQAFISGTHVFNFMAWDAIRAIDYLVTRPEVDAGKIGITGHSGGGMMTTYLLPLEPRITVAVPTCNPTTWRNRVHANLSADHEQVFFGAFASAIDPRGDPLFAQVPKPLLINATTDDPLNPPRGVWDLSHWLFRSYSAHGVPEKFATSMVKAGHDYNQEQREVTNAWMLRWTEQDAVNFGEEDITIEKEEDLWAARLGSAYNEPRSRMPQEWVLDYLTEHKAASKPVQTKQALKEHQSRMSKLINSVLHTNLDNINVTGDLDAPRHVGDLTLRSFVLEPEEGIILPGILLETKTNNPHPDVILYINQNGKSDLLKDINIVKDLLREGYRICAIDLRGIGETAPDMAGKFWDFLAGKPIFGQRVRDILATIKWLKESEIKGRNVKLWGTGMGALYGAFAGVLTDDISALVLEEPLISFENIVQVKMPRYQHEIILPGILKKFDMPQVYQALSPRPIALLSPYSAEKTTGDESDIERMNKTVSATYKAMKAQKAWHIGNARDEERTKMILAVLKDH